MDEIKLKAFAKINLGLDVIGKNDDGYHDVRMVMQTLDLYDDVVLQLSSGTGEITMEVSSDEDRIDISGIPCDDRNLCIKAAKRSFEEWKVAGCNLHIKLVKRIPSEAGMAGGSTDAAAVLVGLNELLGLNKSREDLAVTGLSLGADIPYCIYGGTRLAEGIGEVFTEIIPPIAEIPVVIIKPPFGVSTGVIYNAIDTARDVLHPDIDSIVEDISRGNYKALGGHIGNSMESIVSDMHPEISDIRQLLLDLGAYAACMSGSGTTVYGLFEDSRVADAARNQIQKRNENYFCKLTTAINKGVSHD